MRLQAFTSIFSCSIFLVSWANQLSSEARAVHKSYEDSVITPLHKISSADLEYGKNEIRKIIRDRPCMGQLVKEGDPIWMAAARGFGGELAGSRLKWNSKEDISVETEACYVWGGPVVEICLNRRTQTGELLSAQECWSNLFFEIFNSSRYKEDFVMFREIRTDKCSREDYIKRSAKMEYLAGLQLFAFFKKEWRPRMISGKTAVPVVWFCIEAEKTFDEWYDEWVKRDGPKGYPCGYFGKRYDRIKSWKVRTRNRGGYSS